MTKTKQRQRGRAPDAELDEIVVQLFDDLAKEEPSLKDVRPPAARSDHGPRNRRGESDKVQRNGAFENGVDQGSQTEVPEQDLLQTPPRSRTAPDEEGRQSIPPPHSQQDDDADIKSLTAEEAKFVKHAVSWMAPRPNAELLLRVLQTSLRRSKEANRREKANGKEESDMPMASPVMAEGKPVPSGKRT
jgi:hypothetical protein